MTASLPDPVHEERAATTRGGSGGMLRPPQAKVRPLRVLGELPKLVRLRPMHLADLMRAALELGLARFLLARRSVRELGIPDAAPVNAAPSDPPLVREASVTMRQDRVIARVTKAIAIVAPRVPWRSDCLVQCLAGRRWLARRGIESRITIGVKQERSPDGSPVLLAHAWLSAQDFIVTGGDVTGFGAFPVPHKL